MDADPGQSMVEIVPWFSYDTLIFGRGRIPIKER